MIVVISDLHFEEEASDIIPQEDGHPALVFRRNLNPKAYRSFVARLADEARQRNVRTFELVIAGDLFDFSRTVLWFEDQLRPYVSLSHVSPRLETKLLNILHAIASEPSVKEALDCFRLLSQGRYRSMSDDSNGAEELSFPVEHITIHYLLGNHDRVANATPGLRRQIRELLGVHGEGTFSHIALFGDPAVLVRHGHEYDPDNFSLDLSNSLSIPVALPESAYCAPVFGDFITIDIAVRLPYLLRKMYGDDEIRRDTVLGNLYLRLLQLDDVRPQAAMLDYLLDSSDGSFSERQAWERLVPVIEHLMNDVHNNWFFRRLLRQRARPWTPLLLELARGLLKLGAWRNRSARDLARSFSHHFLGGEVGRPQLLAAREQVITSRQVRAILAGHTHSPQVALIASDPEADRFYINTGTWRNRIPSTPDQRTFGRMKALTYVMLFAADEDPEGKGQQFGSFDYWSGYTRHWTTDNP